MLHFRVEETKAMDFYEAIRQLHLEKERLDKAIATLEALQRGEEADDSVSRRGRRNMPSEERKKVSERMKRYWASRRIEPKP
jgi:hypothetical protein